MDTENRCSIRFADNHSSGSSRERRTGAGRASGGRLTGVGDGVNCLAPARDRFPSFTDLLDVSKRRALATAAKTLRLSASARRATGAQASLLVLSERASSWRPR